jgi:sterol desaturase/sphingolipid hydroxylase (fatty acid hydroxylase superfamily)
MEQIASYFESIPSWHRTLILVGGIMFFWILEGLIPFFHFKYDKFRHAIPNLFFTLTTLIINLGFAFLVVKSCDFVVLNGIGLIQFVVLPMWVELIIAVLLLDLIGAYTIHLIEHKVPWMWRFHVIHHTDEQVDTTTALRHHPGESVFRAVFTILAIWVAGAPIWMVMVYQSISAILSQFNHSNIKIPKSIDRYINWLIVTPNVHRSHHHFERPITDTNYGNIFTIWDRLFKTYRFVPTNKVKYGLDVYQEDSQSIMTLLQVPFKKKKYR